MTECTSGQSLQGLVERSLQRHHLAAAQPLVGRDHHLATRQPRMRLLEAVGREAAEHHRMDGADPRTGQHGIGRLGDHRHVDRDAVALPDAARLQHVGEAADLLVQFAIGDLARFRRIVALPDDRDLVAARGEVPVDAVHRDVGGAVLEPFDRRRCRGAKLGVLHLGVGLDPVDALAVLAPERVGIVDRRRVPGLVGRAVDQRIRSIDGMMSWTCTALDITSLPTSGPRPTKPILFVPILRMAPASARANELGVVPDATRGAMLATDRRL